MEVGQVRVLTLNIGENLQEKLFRLEKGWCLRFSLGPSLHAKTVRIFCNHPPKKDVQYDRRKYYELDWKSISGCKSDRHDVFAEVQIVTAGSFNYYFTVDESDKIENANGQGYYLVDPTLSVGTNDDDITLDCIQCQTVLAKSLGPLDEWEGRLRVAMETGYNMIHITPIQDLGKSNSSYSIKDQLKLNPIFCKPGQSYVFKDVEKLVAKVNREWKMLSMTDLVYNHTANNSDWLQEHPECGYNLENSPHLKPAYLLDRVLIHFSMEVADGKWKHRKVFPTIDSHVQIQTIGDILLDEVFPSFKFEEFYTVNVEDIMKRFKHGIEENRMINSEATELKIIQDPRFQRLQCRIDMDAALKLYNTDRPGATSRSQRITQCCNDLKRKLVELNSRRKAELEDHLGMAVTNYLANIQWRFLNPNGPKIEVVTKEEPLMNNYFIVPASLTGSIGTEEACMYEDSAKLIFASNGWVMGDDPLRNFAEPASNVYLRRELIAWGDSVKLRYGQKPEDCPYLWQRMREYSEETVRIFHSVRLDNCHSTPIHVAEYMLDAARKIRPDLYVVAELFTSREALDNIFINRLGINSLIREGLSAKDAHDLGRLVHRYGGQPVGAFIQPRVKPLIPTMAHAIFYDQTHDNPAPIEKRSAYDLLPSSALIAMACCSTGSNRGYEQMVPHHKRSAYDMLPSAALVTMACCATGSVRGYEQMVPRPIHVVTENRLYTSWADWDNPDRAYVNQTFGITRGKTLLNALHFYMGRNGYTQIYVDQVDGNCVSVTRHKPLTHESIVLIARTSFYKPTDPTETGYIRPITVQGKITEILFEVQTKHTDAFKYVQDEYFINGLPDYYLDMRQHITTSMSKFVTIKPSEDGETTSVIFEKFTPGSVIAFKCVLPSKSHHAILEIRRGIGQFGYLMRSYSGRSLFDETVDQSNFRTIVSKLSLADMNRIFFRCKAEEESEGNGYSVYNIPGFGDMVYCGLRGVMTVLGAIRPNNDLGHPLCNNLRDGDWLPNYICGRLMKEETTKALGEWFENVFSHLAKIPRYLVPCYFDAVVTGAFVVLRQHAFSLMSEYVQDGSVFIQALAMGSVIVCGYEKNAKLPPLSPNLAEPKPPKRVIKKADGTKDEEEACTSLAAGLPHFAAGYTRNWGRDTFISLRGLLLLTGRYQEARKVQTNEFQADANISAVLDYFMGLTQRKNKRCIILAYGGCLRGGLIPNLLNEGVGARYNCRDAVWWWLQAIQEYIRFLPDGITILKDNVSRLYPNIDSEYQQPGECDQRLCDVIQEALQAHASGLKYRERNAGPAVDRDMSDEGFNSQIGVKWDTGFVHGGTQHNCGTWMDKMGSSVKAGNKGKPATPRDGSAVELIGLSCSTFKWLAKLHDSGHYPYSGVKAEVDGVERTVTYREWHDKICENFEKFFWISSTPEPNEKNPELIFSRGIYRDSYLATHFWADTQFRPNFAVSMVVAPEMFTPERAWTALENMRKKLMGPIGIKTLDPGDWSYVPRYNNADDSEEYKTANGFSYHQGPEWVWPVGYFLRAKLHFARRLEAERPGILKETVTFIKTTLTKHYEMIMNSDWRSLPELTDANGEYNPFGCPAQSWTVACIQEVLYDLEMSEADYSVHPVKSEENIVAPL